MLNLAIEGKVNDSKSRQERDYLLSLSSEDSEYFITNIQAQMKILEVGDSVIPLTINNTEYDNAHVCSTFTRYITYAKQELLFLDNKFFGTTLRLLLNALGASFKITKINRIISVNNWLLSTNLYPQIEKGEIKNLTQRLINSFPDHAIMFPSLNHYTNVALIDELSENGYILLPSREIFIFDKKLKDYTKRRIILSDFDLLNTTPYHIVCHEEISSQDYPQIVDLYNDLYIRKYSKCNPAFTARFIKLCHEKKTLTFQGLRKPNNQLAGIIAWFNRNGVMATPLVGYDTTAPLRDGLFRMLTALSLKEASGKNLVFNMSAGCSEFKKRRGGVGFVEYSAVYCKHLPLYRKSIWHLLTFLMTKIGVPLLHRNEF